MEFLRGVLTGQKKLFKMGNINIMSNLPRYPEINMQEIWENTRVDEQMESYFPDKILAARRPPNRTFLFTVK
jgi:hypothetical protein